MQGRLLQGERYPLFCLYGEQGALSGRYSAKNPLPEGNARAQTYNPILPKLDVLIGKMKEIGARHNASVAP